MPEFLQDNIMAIEAKQGKKKLETDMERANTEELKQRISNLSMREKAAVASVLPDEVLAKALWEKHVEVVHKLQLINISLKN